MNDSTKIIIIILESLILIAVLGNFVWVHMLDGGSTWFVKPDKSLSDMKPPAKKDDDDILPPLIS